MMASTASGSLQSAYHSQYASRHSSKADVSSGQGFRTFTRQVHAREHAEQPCRQPDSIKCRLELQSRMQDTCNLTHQHGDHHPILRLQQQQREGEPLLTLWKLSAPQQPQHAEQACGSALELDRQPIGGVVEDSSMSLGAQERPAAVLLAWRTARQLVAPPAPRLPLPSTLTQLYGRGGSTVVPGRLSIMMPAYRLEYSTAWLPAWKRLAVACMCLVCQSRLCDMQQHSEHADCAFPDNWIGAACT